MLDRAGNMIRLQVVCTLPCADPFGPGGREYLGLPSYLAKTGIPKVFHKLTPYNFARPFFFASSSWCFTFNILRKIFPLTLLGISSVNLTPPLNFL